MQLMVLLIKEEYLWAEYLQEQTAKGKVKKTSEVRKFYVKDKDGNIKEEYRKCTALHIKA